MTHIQDLIAKRDKLANKTGSDVSPNDWVDLFDGFDEAVSRLSQIQTALGSDDYQGSSQTRKREGSVA